MIHNYCPKINNSNWPKKINNLQVLTMISNFHHEINNEFFLNMTIRLNVKSQNVFINKIKLNSILEGLLEDEGIFRVTYLPKHSSLGNKFRV